MSAFDLIPGVSLAKNLTSAVIAGGTTYIITKRNATKKLSEEQTKRKAVEKELETIINNTESEKQKAEGRAVAKCAILKNLAWKDGVLSAEEKCVIVDYVIDNADISPDVKIKVIQDIDNKPNMLNGFYGKFSNMNVFLNAEEAKGFRSFLNDLAKSDGDYSKEEKKYIKYIISQIRV